MCPLDKGKVQNELKLYFKVFMFWPLISTYKLEYDRITSMH